MRIIETFDDVDLDVDENWMDPDDPAYQPRKRRRKRRPAAEYSSAADTMGHLALLCPEYGGRRGARRPQG